MGDHEAQLVSVRGGIGGQEDRIGPAIGDQHPIEAGMFVRPRQIAQIGEVRRLTISAKWIELVARKQASDEFDWHRSLLASGPDRPRAA